MPYSYVEISGICEHKDCKEIKELNFSHIIPYISTNNNMSGNSKWPKKGDFFKQFDRTGLFKIELVDGSVLLFGRWLEGSGRSREVQSVVVAEKENLYKFFKLIRVASKKKARPKNGIYTINYHEMFGLIYEKLEKLPDSPVIHPVVDDVLKEIDFYFNNLEIFRRFKQTGNRKIMLLSEPGTGKSSLFYKIARKYKDTMSVVFGMQLNAIAAHMSECAKYKVPTIVFIEDADAVLRADNSAVLNFLDGVLNPPNMAGAFVAMSTNFPDRIEERILQRPGRIDRIFEFGPLTGGFALDCAKLYFGDYISKSVTEGELREIVHQMTGAQIKELAQSCFSYAAGNNREIDVPLIEDVKTRMKKSIQEAYRLAEMNSLASRKKKSVGFNPLNDEDDVSGF
jgi:hypothetical protein